jgi:hypothetical protein
LQHVLTAPGATCSCCRGVVSVSDGTPDAPSGRLYFYLTPMDEVTHNLQVGGLDAIGCGCEGGRSAHCKGVLKATEASAACDALVQAVQAKRCPPPPCHRLL